MFYESAFSPTYYNPDFQAPLQNSCVDFWRMVWQENVMTIVMLTHLYEYGMVKCDRYFPTTNETDFVSGPFVIKLIRFEKRRHCRSHLFIVQNVLEKHHRYVGHIVFLNWPDKGVSFHC